VPARPGNRYSYAGDTYPEIQCALLEEVAEQLRELNRQIRNLQLGVFTTLNMRLNCSETMAIPRLLRDIKKNTTKKRRKPRGKT
jgi:hypothetical protein